MREATMKLKLAPLFLLLGLFACAQYGGTDTMYDMTSPPDMICVDNVAPAMCISTAPQTERDLLNACSDIQPLIRDSRVPAELWDGRCALPPL